MLKYLIQSNLLVNSVLHSSRNKFSISSLVLRDNFERGQRTNVNIVTLGASQHGKTSLSSRITTVLSDHGVTPKSREDIDHTAEERETGVSSNATYLQWWSSSPQYRFSMADLPGSMSYLKNILNHLAHAEVALLLIHPDHGVVQETKDLYQLARHFGVHLIIPVINKTVHTDDETIDLVMMEMEELEGIEDPIVIEDMPNNNQTVKDLVTKIETTLEDVNFLSNRRVEDHFMMVIEQVGKIPNRGTFCAGRVLQGKVGIRGEVDAFYQGKTGKAVVKDLEIYREGTSEIQAGDRAGAFISIKKPEIELKRGAALYDSKLNKQLMFGKRWEVSVCSIPGSGQVAVKGNGVVYCSTQMDGKASLNCQAVEEMESNAILELSNDMIAGVGEKFVMRCNHGFILGTIITSIK